MFKLKKTDHIGAAGAENDSEFLSACFIDKGDLEIISNPKDHRTILLGRAGAGKTALIGELKAKHDDFVITIDPDQLALTYVSGSNILHFFRGIGVNLDPFFKLLWRHVLTVEILNRYFSLSCPRKNENLIDRLLKKFSGQSKQDREMKQAIEYLKKWGSKFWQETEFRVKEITEKLEDNLCANAGAKLQIPGFSLSAAIQSGHKFSEEQIEQLYNHGQKIVSETQIRELATVLNLLDNVLSDRQKIFYVVIDRLDENWAEEQLRYKLIMALINCSRDFSAVSHAKIVIALRRDLIERVFKLTRQGGFQEEKYESLYLPLCWDRSDLISVLDKRINFLVSKRYTKQVLTHKDLLPKSYRQESITDFISKVTLRPRDVIDLFNACIRHGNNSSRLKAPEFKEAMGDYSRSRLKAVGDEWSAEYPTLLDYANILKNKPHSFKIGSIGKKEIEELCLNILSENPPSSDSISQKALQVVDCIAPPEDFVVFLSQIFYHVGLVGLKIEHHEKGSWADEMGRSISAAEITSETSVIVHPTFHRVLGINSKRR